MKYQKRSAFGWGGTAAGWADPDRGLVIHYDGSDQGLAHKAHSSCVAYWQATRRFHMGARRGWADIGYSFGCCPHGYVLEGRGLHRQQAAQPGGNSTWYSVTLMSGPGEQPTDEQIQAVRQLRAWLMRKGVRGTVRGHRDFVSTSCPGGVLYRMVQDGTFAGDAKPYKWDGRAPSEFLEVGDSGWAVRDLQHALLAVGEKLPRYGPDGDFGAETKAAVRSFQRRHGLDVDGLYGNNTERELRNQLEDARDSEGQEQQDQEDDDMGRHYYGQFVQWPDDRTVSVSVHAGDITWAGFNVGKGCPPVRLRVAASFTDGTAGDDQEVTALPIGGGTRKSTAKLVTTGKTVDGFSVTLLDDGAPAVGWDAT